MVQEKVHWAKYWPKCGLSSYSSSLSYKKIKLILALFEKKKNTFKKKFCPLCLQRHRPLAPVSSYRHICTKIFPHTISDIIFGHFLSSPLLSSSPHHINERSIKWLDPLILSLVCKYDMTDYYWSWVKTNLILTLHKIFSFDKVPTVLQYLMQYIKFLGRFSTCR